MHSHVKGHAIPCRLRADKKSSVSLDGKGEGCIRYACAMLLKSQECPERNLLVLNCYAQVTVCDRPQEFAHVLAPLVQHVFQCLSPRLPVILEPVTKSSHVSLNHTLQRRVLLEPDNLLRIQLQHVLDDIVMRNVVTPAFSADLVARMHTELGGCLTGDVGLGTVEVGLQGGCCSVILRREGIVAGRRVCWRRVIEMDVEEEMVIIAFGITLFEFARDGPIRWADIAVHDLAEHCVYVGNLSQLKSIPIV